MTLHMLASGDVPEQNLGLCVSLRNLVERNSVQVVEQAYRMAVAEGEAPTLRVLDKYVKQIKQQSETDPKSAPKKTPKSTPKRETLGFTRGSGYYE